MNATMRYRYGQPIDAAWTAQTRKKRGMGRASRLVRHLFIALMAAALAASGGGCSIKHMAVNSLGDALAGSGDVYAADEDIELIGAASPFGLKLTESLLAESPEHRGLLLAAARGFTQYAYAYVELPAAERELQNIATAYAEYARARKLYLRARDYGVRGLAVTHPELRETLRRDPQAALAVVEHKDVALLYWTAAAWGSAIALGKDMPELVGELPQVGALIDRALALEEDFGTGAIHTFLISFEMARPGPARERVAQARRHFERAVMLAGGRQAAPYVTYAEAVTVTTGDRAEFEALLRQALNVDSRATSQWTLANQVFQHRARWLLAHTDHFFSN